MPLVLIALLTLLLPASAQVRKLHTRDLTRLSQVQVAEQLKHSDIIFIPVGAVETNGIQPSGRDYTWPLAYAQLMAEETGGLYTQGLVWSFPGTTALAPATINNTPTAGTAFLKNLAHSLLRQGFRRETEMLLECIIREDRNVVDLLDADYTFVDETLAKHYGMTGIRGSRNGAAHQDQGSRAGSDRPGPGSSPACRRYRIHGSSA